MKILFVEDESSARRAFSQILSLSGYDVAEAADGEEALRLLEERSFDLVLLDIRVPKISGLSLVPHIRAKWPATRVLAMSAYLDPADVNYLVNDKVVFLSKPVNATDLLEIVNRLRTASAAAPSG